MLRIAVCVLIALATSPAAAAQFSVKCGRDGWYFLTFGDVTKRVVAESPGGMAYKGVITSLSPGGMRFELFSVGQPNHEFHWNREANAFLAHQRPERTDPLGAAL